MRFVLWEETIKDYDNERKVFVFKITIDNTLNGLNMFIITTLRIVITPFSEKKEKIRNQGFLRNHDDYFLIFHRKMGYI